MHLLFSFLLAYECTYSRAEKNETEEYFGQLNYDSFSTNQASP
jgi:hypothetical protein